MSYNKKSGIRRNTLSPLLPDLTLYILWKDAVPIAFGRQAASLFFGSKFFKLS